MHALMRDIGSLRQRLETDLTLTAAALEHEEIAVADDLLADGLQQVHTFEQQASLRLGETLPWPAPITYLPPPRRLPGVRGVAAAAALAAFGVVVFASPASQGGVVLQATAPPPDRLVRVADPVISTASLGLARTYDAISVLAQAPEEAQDSEIREVADQLTQQVTGLLAAPETEPQASLAALKALRAERDVLRANDQDGSLEDLLTRNAQFTDTLIATLTALVPDLNPILRPGQPAPSAPPALTDLLNGLTPQK